MALNARAEDFNGEDDYYEVITSPENFSSVREALESKGIEFAEAEVKMIPQNNIKLAEQESVKMQRFVDMLEDNDEVQNGYHNEEE